jgi:hypothetical protein
LQRYKIWTGLAGRWHEPIATGAALGGGTMLTRIGYCYSATTPKPSSVFVMIDPAARSQAKHYELLETSKLSSTPGCCLSFFENDGGFIHTDIDFMASNNTHLHYLLVPQNVREREKNSIILARHRRENLGEVTEH